MDGNAKRKAIEKRHIKVEYLTFVREYDKVVERNANGRITAQYITNLEMNPKGGQHHDRNLHPERREKRH